MALARLADVLAMLVTAAAPFPGDASLVVYDAPNASWTETMFSVSAAPVDGTSLAPDREDRFAQLAQIDTPVLLLVGRLEHRAQPPLLRRGRVRARVQRERRAQPVVPLEEQLRSGRALTHAWREVALAVGWGVEGWQWQLAGRAGTRQVIANVYVQLAELPDGAAMLAVRYHHVARAATCAR